MRSLVIAICLLLGLSLNKAYGHGGGLSENGCHLERSTGQYHCHRGEYSGMVFNSIEQALDYFASQIQELEGIIVEIQPEPEPEPEPVTPEPISIPGGGVWVPVPNNMTVQGFRVMNNYWVAGGAKWLYVFKVGGDMATGFLLRNPTNVGSGVLTEQQIADILARIIESE